MNKKTEKKTYVAPQMNILQMNTSCTLLQGSGDRYYQQGNGNTETKVINDGYTPVDFQ